MRNRNNDRFDWENGQPKERKTFPIEIMQIDEDTGIVDAIVAVMGNIDDGDDIIHPGAFIKSISERTGRIPMLDNHNHFEGRDVIGKPLEIREIDRSQLPASLLARHPEATGGLFTRTQFFIDEPSDNSAVVFRRIKAGAINQYSIGFDALDTDNSHLVDEEGNERDVRNIRSIRLWEFSPVIFAMNTATTTVGVKSHMSETERQNDFTIEITDLPLNGDAISTDTQLVKDADGNEWDVRIRTTVRRAKSDEDVSEDTKAATDAPNLQAAPVGSAQICHLCEHFSSVTVTRGYCDQFDFLTDNDDLCDAFSVKGQAPLEETKETDTRAGSSPPTPTDEREKALAKLAQMKAELESMEA